MCGFADVKKYALDFLPDAATGKNSTGDNRARIHGAVAPPYGRRRAPSCGLVTPGDAGELSIYPDSIGVIIGASFKAGGLPQYVQGKP